jgi:hypothetical protein
MALFRCNQSGNVVEFRQDFDIIEMRRHHQYTEVDTSAVVEVEKVDGTRQTLTLKKPMGRPRKEQLL